MLLTLSFAVKSITIITAHKNGMSCWNTTPIITYWRGCVLTFFQQVAFQIYKFAQFIIAWLQFHKMEKMKFAKFPFHQFANSRKRFLWIWHFNICQIAKMNFANCKFTNRKSTKMIFQLFRNCKTMNYKKSKSDQEGSNAIVKSQNWQNCCTQCWL